MKKPQLLWVKTLYGTGVPQLDEQHKEVFEQANSFLDAVDRGISKGEIENLLNYLESYIKQHFACEERVMQARNCSACGENKTAHAQFIKDYSRLRRLYKESSASEPFLEEMSSFLLNWLRNHIGRIDIKLRETVAGPSGD